ncbi:hypothetical protein SNL152K_7667 [Streptomyces sp. NL15-2K]|nr:hypothetical protein SNL152K_7667 [Streptomyces sp. NL15-2K]
MALRRVQGIRGSRGNRGKREGTSPWWTYPRAARPAVASI